MSEEYRNEHYVPNGVASPPLAQTDNLISLDHVAVTLDTYVGTAKLTVSALKSLTPGEVFELDAQLNEHVELRLNGTAVARGELVAVGDKFGVRITAVG